MKKAYASVISLIIASLIVFAASAEAVFAGPVVLKDESRGIGVEDSTAPERDRSLQDGTLVYSMTPVYPEDVEEGGDMLVEMFSENPSLFSLNQTELKEAIAKSIMLDPKLNGEYKKITEAVVHYINNDEGFQYLREAIDIDDESDNEEKTPEAKVAEGEAPAENAGEEKKDDEKKEDDDKAEELTAEDKEKLVSALKTVVEKITDEKIKEMAENLLKKFDNDDEGTRPEDVKEAVRFLSI